MLLRCVFRVFCLGLFCQSQTSYGFLFPPLCLISSYESFWRSIVRVCKRTTRKLMESARTYKKYKIKITTSEWIFHTCTEFFICSVNASLKIVYTGLRHCHRELWILFIRMELVSFILSYSFVVLTQLLFFFIFIYILFYFDIYYLFLVFFF